MNARQRRRLRRHIDGRLPVPVGGALRVEAVVAAIKRLESLPRHDLSETARGIWSAGRPAAWGNP